MKRMPLVTTVLLVLAGVFSAVSWAQPPPSGPDAEAPAARRRLQEALQMPVGGPSFIAAALGIAFALGAAHALTPGHGKTIVAAYLVGSRGTIGDAVYLGSVVTLTHTSSVFVLGFLTLYASQHVRMDRIYPWLSVVSGSLVATMGAWLLITRWRRTQQDHAHHHDHEHAHDHSHHHDHPHPHRHQGEARSGERPSRWSLLSLGVSGGLVPCPEAMVVLLMAVSLQKLILGLVLLVAFSLGLAAVLIAIGVAMILSGPLLSRFSSQGRLTRALPIGSAAVVTLLGLGIVYRAVVDGWR